MQELISIISIMLGVVVLTAWVMWILFRPSGDSKTEQFASESAKDGLTLTVIENNELKNKITQLERELKVLMSAGYGKGAEGQGGTKDTGLRIKDEGRKTKGEGGKGKGERENHSEKLKKLSEKPKAESLKVKDEGEKLSEKLKVEILKGKDEGQRAEDEVDQVEKKAERIERLEEELKIKGEIKKEKMQRQEERSGTKDTGQRTKDEGRKTKGEGQKAEIKDEGSRVKDEGLKTQDEGGDHSEKPKAESVRAKDAGLRIKDEGLRTKDEGLKTNDETEAVPKPVESIQSPDVAPLSEAQRVTDEAEKKKIADYLASVAETTERQMKEVEALDESIKNTDENSEYPEDDLKKIKGIGPHLEGKLKKAGISSHQQIAEFTEADIQRVSKQIGFFPRRIKRDGWVAQAKEILSRKS